MFPEYRDKATSLQENDNKVQCMEWNLDKRGSEGAFDVKKGTST